MPCIMAAVDQFEWGGAGRGTKEYSNQIDRHDWVSVFTQVRGGGHLVTVTRLRPGNFLTKLTSSFHQELEMSDVLC